MTNHVWLSCDTLPPSWDESEHLRASLEYHRILSGFASAPDFSAQGITETLRSLVRVDSYVYPPLFKLAGGLLLFVGDRSIDTLAATNVLFLAILIVSVFLIGRRIGDDATGVLSALVILLYPAVFGLARAPMIDFALLAMTAMCTCLLFHANLFSRPSLTVLFGISFGLGMLTKPAFLTYMLIPTGFVTGRCLYEFARGRIEAKELRRRTVWATASLLAALLVAGLWYGPHAHQLEEFRQIAMTELQGQRPFGVETLFYYAHVLVGGHIGIPFLVLFVYGLLRLGRSMTRADAGLLVLWIAGLYVVLTLVPQKTDRQSIGLLLPIGLISAAGLRSLPRYRSAVTVLVLLFGAVQFAALSLPGHVLTDRFGGIFRAGGYVAARPPEPVDWRIAETVRELDREEVRKIGVVSDHRFVNGQTFASIGMLLELPFEIVKCRDSSEDFLENLATYDIVIGKSDWVPARYRSNPGIDENTNAILLDHFSRNTGLFDPPERKPLPDGSDLLVYRLRRGDRRRG